MAVRHCVVCYSRQEEHVVFVCDVNNGQSVFIEGETNLIFKWKHQQKLHYEWESTAWFWNMTIFSKLRKKLSVNLIIKVLWLSGMVRHFLATQEVTRSNPFVTKFMSRKLNKLEIKVLRLMSHLFSDMFSVRSIVNNALSIMGVSIIAIATRGGWVLRVAHINNNGTWNMSVNHMSVNFLLNPPPQIMTALGHIRETYCEDVETLTSLLNLKTNYEIWPGT